MACTWKVGQGQIDESSFVIQVMLLLYMVIISHMFLKESDLAVPYQKQQDLLEVTVESANRSFDITGMSTSSCSTMFWKGLSSK